VAQFQTFDIVVVPFPYSDRLEEKRRPAIIISSQRLEDNEDVVWLAMITSSATGATQAVAIADMGPTGLHKPSFVRPAKIATVETHRILRKTGQLSGDDATSLAASLKFLAGF
jgi:mRNA interferase MazF